jgi:hypothetical protein
MKFMEILDITCPKCNQVHHYKLEVDRSIVLEQVSLSYRASTFTRFTRLFTCPIKKENFQAVFTLEESSSNRIDNVVSYGMAQDGNKSN